MAYFVFGFLVYVLINGIIKIAEDWSELLTLLIMRKKD